MNRLMSAIVSTALVFFSCFFGQSILAQETHVTYYHNDALGSPIFTTDDSANGSVTSLERYSAYGEKAVNLASRLGESIDYTGHVFDGDTGLIYAQARYYDPIVGRFLSIDPLGFMEANIHSFNRYAYANNNPHKFFDPDGREPEDVYAAAGMDDYVNPLAYRAQKINNGMSRTGNAIDKEAMDPWNWMGGVAGKLVGMGLRQNKLYKAALGQYKNSDLTHAGRGVTKHPEYFGFKSTQDLREVYNTDDKINRLGADGLKEIMRNGARTEGKGGRYPNGWITYTLPDGRAASWHVNGEFIGFRGVQP